MVGVLVNNKLDEALRDRADAYAMDSEASNGSKQWYALRLAYLTGALDPINKAASDKVTEERDELLQWSVDLISAKYRLVDNLIQLTTEHPNDAELGAVIRSQYGRKET